MDQTAPSYPKLNRRVFLAAAPAVALLRAGPAAAQARPPFAVPPLPYDYAALEPVISSETMMLHHDKHHQAYVNALNLVLADQPALRDLSPRDLLANLQAVPEPIRATVRNNAGGHLNHTMFWQAMRPGGTAMLTPLKNRIEQDFGSVEVMKTKFEEAGLRQFGSGWVFLAYDVKANRTEVLTTPNQDTLDTLPGKVALLGNDVWEHAYYLTYRNRRADYLRAWWPLADWSYATRRLDAARAGKVPA